MGRFGASPPDGLKRQKVTRSHRTDEWTADLFSQERMYVGTTPVRRCVGCWSIASFRVANQLRRFGREPDTGSGGSRDLIQGRAFDYSGPQTSQGRARTYFRSHNWPSYGSELADLDFKIGEESCAVATRLLRDAPAVSASSRKAPANTDGQGVPPDDSAGSTGVRLGLCYPASPVRPKRLQSHRWGS